MATDRKRVKLRSQQESTTSKTETAVEDHLVAAGAAVAFRVSLKAQSVTAFQTSQRATVTVEAFVVFTLLPLNAGNFIPRLSCYTNHF